MADEPAQDVQTKTEAIQSLIGEPVGEVETPTTPAVPGIGDGSPTPDQGAPGSPPGGDPETETLTPAVLAERLGMTPAELFRDFEIPVDGGEPLSLGDFKDAGKILRDVRDAKNDLAEKRVTFENETMQQRQTLQAAIGKIPPELLTPELIDTVQREHSLYVQGERDALLKVRPDLGDAAKWGKIRPMIEAHLAPYGFRASEIENIIDHRLAKYVIDNAEREVRTRELVKVAGKQKIPLLRPSKAKPVAKSARVTRESAVKRGRRATGSQEKTAAVAALLGNQ